MEVCVIGGGVSGLVSIKSCLESGLKVVCYEKGWDVGGVWRIPPEDSSEESSMPECTVTNTSKEFTAFSDFPMPSDYPNFQHNRLFLKYLRSYCRHFNLTPFIHFGHEVTQVVKADDYQSSGRWIVKTKSEDGRQTTEKTFDSVIVCNGIHKIPYVCEMEGSELFRGSQMHSKRYRNNRPFRGKRVLVIGCRNSAADVAVDLTNVAERVYMSTRNGFWLLSRLSNKGYPLDREISRFLQHLMYMLPFPIANYFTERLFNSFIDHKFYDIKSDVSVLKSRSVTVNSELTSRILSGQIAIKGPVENIVEDGVRFHGEDKVIKLDDIIYATGYRGSVRFIDPDIILDDRNCLKAYRGVFPFELKHPTLAFVGYIKTNGPIPPLAELQSRWIAQVFVKKVKLPSIEIMRLEYESRLEAAVRLDKDPTVFQFDQLWLPYSEQLASEIGAKPKITRLLFTNPKLAMAYLFGPVVSYHYRLIGPHVWPLAAQTTLEVEQRVRKPLRTRTVRRRTDRFADNWFNFSFKSILMIISIAGIIYKLKFVNF